MRFRPITAAAALAASLSQGALAQLESPLMSKVYPNIVNPGGKSLAMGGAFAAVADDATAAFANPAGLPQLGSWEVGVSGKDFSFTPRLSTANYLETAPGQYALSSYDVYEPMGGARDLEFASLVVPVSQELTLAGYRAVNLRYKLDASDLAGGSYRSFYVNRGFTSSTSLDEAGGIDLSNVLYGVSAGLRMGRVSIGGGVTFNKLSYELTGGASGGAHTFIANGDNGDSTDVPDPRFEIQVTPTVTSGTKAGWIAGVRIELTEAGRVSVGAVYRRNPSFDIDYRFAARAPGFPGPPQVEFSCGVDDPSLEGSGKSACGRFHVPDDWAVSVAAAPVRNLLLVAEVQRVYYSQLNDGFVPVVAYYGCEAGASAACDIFDRKRAIAWGSADDGTLPRVGAEYTVEFASGTQLSLRAGWFREPAHGTKLTLYPDSDFDRRPDPGKPPINLVNPPLTDAYNTSFDGGQAEDHVSFGVGTTLGRKLSVDLAVDLGKTSRQIVLSAFLRM